MNGFSFAGIRGLSNYALILARLRLGVKAAHYE